MANPSKDKGTAAETAVVGYLRKEGFPHADRKRSTGSQDRGDIHVYDGCEWTIEVKDCRTTELAGWMTQALAEKANAGTRWTVVWHKRRGKASPGAWYVTMTGSNFLDVLRNL